MTVCLLSCLARSEAALLLAILFFKRLIWRAISKPRTILFSLSIGRFSSSCSSPIYTSYHQGRLQTKLNLRKTVIKLAVAGSPAAEPLADKYMKEQSINE